MPALSLQPLGVWPSQGKFLPALWGSVKGLCPPSPNIRSWYTQSHFPSTHESLSPVSFPYPVHNRICTNSPSHPIPPAAHSPASALPCGLLPAWQCGLGFQCSPPAFKQLEASKHCWCHAQDGAWLASILKATLPSLHLGRPKTLVACLTAFCRVTPDPPTPFFFPFPQRQGSLGSPGCPGFDL